MSSNMINVCVIYILQETIACWGLYNSKLLATRFCPRMAFNKELVDARRIPINGLSAIRFALFFTVILLACNPLIPSWDEESRR